MHTTNLRRVGGSIMLAVPRPLLNVLHMEAGAKVSIAIDDGRLVIEPAQRRKYTLKELIAQCNPKARRTKEEKEWLDSEPVGNELL
jgi:antitoxin ChpS